MPTDRQHTEECRERKPVKQQEIKRRQRPSLPQDVVKLSNHHHHGGHELT